MATAAVAAVAVIAVVVVVVVVAAGSSRHDISFKSTKCTALLCRRSAPIDFDRAPDDPSPAFDCGHALAFRKLCVRKGLDFEQATTVRGLSKLKAFA